MMTESDMVNAVGDLLKLDGLRFDAADLLGFVRWCESGRGLKGPSRAEWLAAGFKTFASVQATRSAAAHADTVFPDQFGEILRPPQPPGWNIPRVKPWPAGSVQCNLCGGWGERDDSPCPDCDGNGWVPYHSPHGRRCANENCGNPIPPDQVAVYCSNECAFEDA